MRWDCVQRYDKRRILDNQKSREGSILAMDATLDGLKRIRDTLQTDGYDLRVDKLSAGRLELSVVALDGACEECLVPKRLMEKMIANSLTDSAVKEIKLRYPEEIVIR